MTYLCMSWDHRALDGVLAAKFLVGGAAVTSRSGVVRSSGSAPWGGCRTWRASRCRSGCGTPGRRDEIPDLLLLLEHPPVYTKGRRAEPGRPADGRGVVPVAGHRRGRLRPRRSGDLPRPGPARGLSDHARARVPAYVHTMEGAIVAALADEGIEAEVRGGLTGVWAGESKIGSIGVHVSRGVTTHGFAVNVDSDLQPFE